MDGSAPGGQASTWSVPTEATADHDGDASDDYYGGRGDGVDDDGTGDGDDDAASIRSGRRRYRIWQRLELLLVFLQALYRAFLK